VLNHVEDFFKAENDHAHHVCQNRDDDGHSHCFKHISDHQDLCNLVVVAINIVSDVGVCAVLVELLLVQVPHLLHEYFVVEQLVRLHEAKTFNEEKDSTMVEMQNGVEGQ